MGIERKEFTADCPTCPNVLVCSNEARDLVWCYSCRRMSWAKEVYMRTGFIEREASRPPWVITSDDCEGRIQFMIPEVSDHHPSFHATHIDIVGCGKFLYADICPNGVHVDERHFSGFWRNGEVLWDGVHWLSEIHFDEGPSVYVTPRLPFVVQQCKACWGIQTDQALSVERNITSDGSILSAAIEHVCNIPKHCRASKLVQAIIYRKNTERQEKIKEMESVAAMQMQREMVRRFISADVLGPGIAETISDIEITGTNEVKENGEKDG